MFNKVYLLRPFVITCSSAGMHIESGINILYINCLKLYSSGAHRPPQSFSPAGQRIPETPVNGSPVHSNDKPKPAPEAIARGFTYKEFGKRGGGGVQQHVW